MPFKFRDLFYVIRNMIFFLFAVAVMSIALLELIFAPMLAIKYMLPGLVRHRAVVDFGLITFYVACLAVQAANFFASCSLFMHSLLTGYQPQWFAFDALTLLSASISLALVAQQATMPYDAPRYLDRFEHDIYVQTARAGDQICRRSGCRPTDVFVWHQQAQCCGWHSANDLRGQRNLNDTDLLADFCCMSRFAIGSSSSSSSSSSSFVAASGSSRVSCRIDSPLRFAATCDTQRESFLTLRSVSIVSHPCSWQYSVLKVTLALAFTAVKKHSFVPQAEGLYSYYVLP